MSEITLDFGEGVLFAIDEERREVETRFSDGYVMAAQRPIDVDNLNEAIGQGYSGPDPCFDSLVEHEAFHTLVARAATGCRDSLVLRHESGAQEVRYGLRLHEEALVLSVQYFVNTGVVDRVLEPFMPEIGQRATAMRDWIARRRMQALRAKVSPATPDFSR